MTKCQKLTSEDWTTEEGVMSDTGSESTLLHYAAAMGYTRLVCSLLHWAAEHPGRRLGREVDALAKDGEGFTPMVSILDLYMVYQWENVGRIIVLDQSMM